MRGDKEACRLTIGSLLDRELQLFSRFEAILSSEYRSITERDIAALEQIISDKSSLLEQLAALEQERTRALRDAGFGADHTAMHECLRSSDPQQILSAQWQTLQRLAYTCSAQNRKNQQLVDLCSRRVRDVLHVLRGEEPGQQTYLADGEADHRHSSRSLAKV